MFYNNFLAAFSIECYWFISDIDVVETVSTGQIEIKSTFQMLFNN